jgi:hypothetical protein
MELLHTSSSSSSSTAGPPMQTSAEGWSGQDRRPPPRRWRQKAPRERSGQRAFANAGRLEPELDRYPPLPRKMS